MLALQAALKASNVRPDMVGFVQVLAPGTVTHDFSVSAAVREAFSGGMPIASLVGATGWVLGAGGATELIVATAALVRGHIPPSVGCEPIDATLGVSPSAGRRALESDHAVVHTSSLGGRSIAFVVGATP